MRVSEAAAELKTSKGKAVPFQGMEVRGGIRDLLAEVTITQRYRNGEEENVEAVYTFPLPLDAVLLDFKARMGERLLESRILEAAQAEDRYEEAVTDGDGAVLLEQAEPNLYTVSVGNLLPGETAEIAFRFAMFLDWRDGEVRFFLPTTLAPRYGDPEKAGLRPHQAPEDDLWVEHLYDLSLEVSGMLREASVQSPSHAVAQEKGDEATVVTLAGGREAMDRDLVVTFRADRGAFEGGAACGRDLKGHVVAAFFRPEFPRRATDEPQSFKIVVDCSGSMGGDSIRQAKKALAAILDELAPGDFFNFVAFGTRHQALFPRQEPADEVHLQKARRFVERLDADMGGTEMGAALEAAFDLPGPPELPRSVLLVTDGEVWDGRNIVKAARRSGHRLFTVGVGAAVSEGLVRQLAASTEGAAETAYPGEDMARKVVAHFRRIRTPGTVKAEVSWPLPPRKVFPESSGPVYAGEALRYFAWFDEEPRGEVSFRARLADGTLVERGCQVLFPHEEDAAPEASTLARMGAHALMQPLRDRDAVLELALPYQLVSPHTHLFALAPRSEGERAKDLPKLRKTPHMRAAGWGGLGSVAAKASVASPRCRKTPRLVKEKILFERSCERERSPDIESLSLSMDVEGGGFPADSRNKFWILADFHLQRDARWLPSFDTLIWEGLPRELVDFMKERERKGEDPRTVFTLLLYHLMSQRPKPPLSRQSRRVVRKAYKGIEASASLEGAVRRAVENCSW